MRLFSYSSSSVCSSCSRRALLGPPIGGALYARWGYRAPFVFGMISTVLNLVGLVFVVEGSSQQVQDQSHRSEIDHLAEKAVTSGEQPQNQTLTAAESKLPNPPTMDDNPTTGTNQPHRKIGDAPILLVFWRLMTSPRPFAALLVVFFAA